jgi:hypothetical protein
MSSSSTSLFPESVVIGVLVPLSRATRLRFWAKDWNINAVFRLALTGPTSSFTFRRNRKASLEASISSSDFARVVNVGCTIRVAHSASTGGEGIKAGWGFSRDVPAATTLVRNVKPSMTIINQCDIMFNWYEFTDMIYPPDIRWYSVEVCMAAVSLSDMFLLQKRSTAVGTLGQDHQSEQAYRVSLVVLL